MPDPQKKIRFDGTINLGHLLAVATFIGAGMVGWNALANQLVVDEGLVLKPYRCTAGKLRIGIGRNLNDVGLSKAEAMMLLNTDIDKVESQLHAALPWWRGMSDARQQALANMCFNMVSA